MKKILGFNRWIIATLLFLIPQLFWGKLYDIGGDDTRLYYLFPWEFITKFARHIIVNNALGVKSDYYTLAFFTPFMALMSLVKEIAPFIHIQHFFMGLNLAAGFLFFGLLVCRFIRNESHRNEIAIVGGLSYVFSNFLIHTVYTHQLLSMYLVSVIPAMLYFFLKGIQEKRIIYTLFASLIYSVFSTGMNTMPWFAGVIIVCMPLFIHLFFLYKKEFFLHALVLALSTFLLNAYWIVHYIYPLLSRNSSAGGLVGVNNAGFLEGTIDLVQSLSRLNSPLNVFFNTIRASWNTVPFYDVSFILNGITFFLILLAGFLLKRSQYRNYYVIFFSSLLLSFFFIGPSFGTWSVNVYIWLVRFVPMFTIFRNMYDKFSIAVALLYALSLSVSLAMIVEAKIRKVMWYFLISVLMVLPIINALPMLFPRYNDNRYSTRVTGVFNTDYQDLVASIQSMNDPSRYLWLPLNVANYVYLSDKLPGHYYFGPSPLLLLSGATDFTGLLSFGTPFDYTIAYQLKEQLIEKNYRQIGELFQHYNINYIILNREGLVSERKKYLFDLDLYELQNEQLFNALLGEKVKDFGERYSLFRITPQFSSDKIYLSAKDTLQTDLFSKVEFTKKDSYVFDIKLPVTDAERTLVFLETYNKEWELRAVSPTKQILLAKVQPVQVPYANTFGIEPTKLRSLPSDMFIQDGNSTFVHARLYFGPQKYTIFGTVVSISSGILIMAVIIISAIKNKRKKIV